MSAGVIGSDEGTVEKLAALRAYFGDAPHSSARPGATAAAGFSDLLFDRAPIAYLQFATLDALKAIALEVRSFFDKFIEQGESFAVSVYNPTSPAERNDVTSVTIAVPDKPFLLDTVSELLHHRRHDVLLILDPILRDAAGRRFCVIYTELPRIADAAQREELRQEISLALADLDLVIDDFTAMVVRAETAARHLERGDGRSVEPHLDFAEIQQFLHWLCDDSFVFLGYREWKDNGTLTVNAAADLGLFRSTSPAVMASLETIESEAELLQRSDEPLLFTKTLAISPVHRRVRMEFIGVRGSRNDDGSVALHGFLGLFTSKSNSQEGSSVPLIRRKIEQLIEIEQGVPHSRDYKDIISIIDSTPKSKLLQLSLTELRSDLELILSARQQEETRVSLHFDRLHRSAIITVILPRERFASDVREQAQQLVEQALGSPPDASEYKLVVGDEPIVRMYFFTPAVLPAPQAPAAIDLEQQIAALTFTWEDSLFAELTMQHGASIANTLSLHYARALPEQYKAATGPREAAADISIIETLSEDQPLELSLRIAEEDSNQQFMDLKIYKQGAPLTLSTTLPFLENAGLDILYETSTRLRRGANDIAIYNFRVRSKSGRKIAHDVLQTYLVPGLKRVITGNAENDELNSLLLEPGIDLRRIAILRILQRYLWQLKAFSTPNTIISAIKQNPDLAGILVEYFEQKFNPDIFVDDMPGRQRTLDELRNKFSVQLRHVSDLLHDRILRALLNVIDSSVRTNYFQSENSFRLALKINCVQVTDMPKPRPMVEIFVTAPQFEGVHLRGGKVARGGLRWSERPDDFRTEVLGLMKTQMVKNSIIIPTGAKGGFVVKHPAPTPELVKQSYCEFIQSLLELTDNRLDGRIVPPPRCVVHDEPDPYLVVAADKGTAVFSDVANDIAVNKFNFWLGDAFASGGSHGYDHKKLGITARGAWEAVSRHFREIGIDINTQTFTMVGIGDMSGDVFGNGLMLSDNAKLIAAFNHKHIFIDPDPDPKVSIEERKRLFALPRSNWTDYNPALISQGGGVFNRLDKEIPISPEIQRALDVTENVLSGQELIRAILRAPVDLLWNGGIGTYVKASSETHLMVGDRTNDDVRIDARELRVKIVGEGGNLGFTQLARIEYSKLGGHCNTDAVDNSGGVDCSDYEVNIKILLQAPVKRGDLPLEERNELLRSLSDEVTRKVVSRNRSQSKILSLGVRRSRRNIDYYRGLISSLEAEGVLDREAEFLPDDESLSKRGSMKVGLTRPESAILIAYVKNSLCKTIYESSLPDEPFLQRYLFSYFPRVIVERFPQDTANHPLAREIIAKQIANSLVERVGSSFVYRIAEETGAPQVDIIAAFLASDAILNAEGLSRELQVMDRANTTNVYLKSLLTLTWALDAMTRWFLERRNINLTWSEIIDRYRGPVATLLDETENVFTAVELRRFEESYNQLVLNAVPKNLARAVAAIVYTTSYLDIADISTTGALDVLSVARLYGQLAAEFQITRLLEQTLEIEPADRWEALAVRALTAQLRSSIGELTKSVIAETSEVSTDGVNRYLDARKETVQRFRHSLREFHNRSLTIPALLVISNQLFALSRPSQ